MFNKLNFQNIKIFYLFTNRSLQSLISSFLEYFRVLEFGAIGTILGHELTHGFDNLGRKFDINGNLKNWWSQASLKEFKKRSNCIKKQYNNYYWEAAGSYVRISLQKYNVNTK